MFEGGKEGKGLKKEKERGSERQKGKRNPGEYRSEEASCSGLY